MNLANINLQHIFEKLGTIIRESQHESLSLDCGRLLRLVKTAKCIFKDRLKVRIGKQWYTDITLETIIKARDSYDVIELCFDNLSDLINLTYGFDEELGYWICILKPTKDYQNIVLNLILTQKLAPITPFELNMGSFKVVELANNLRKA